MATLDLFWPTVHALASLFAGGAALVLALAHGNLRRVLRGELGARYLGWLLLVPFYLLALFAGGAVGWLLLAGAMARATWEVGRAARLTRAEWALLAAAAAVSLTVPLVAPALWPALPALLALALLLGALLSDTPALLLTRGPRLLGCYSYTIWTLAHVLLLWQLPHGRGVLLLALAGCGLADIGAYCVGRAIGQVPIAAGVNPRKCWEGLLGNGLGAALALTLFRFALPPLGLLPLLALLLLIALGSATGDLLSSLLKRSAGLKDWGTVLPGHGGLLDRLNSVLLVLPLLYYFLLL